MPDFLVVSLVASVVLTILLNAVLWLFPRAGRWTEDGLRRLAESSQRRTDDAPGGVRVIFPWKFMLIASLGLTLALNLLLFLR